MKCKVCGNLNDDEKSYYQVKEMLFGTRDVFQYYYCPYCKCLQIVDVPKNLGYYYSVGNYQPHISHPRGKIYEFLKSKQRLHYLGKRTVIGKILSTIKPLYAGNFYDAMKSLGKGDLRNDYILDVGCGNGSFLDELKSVGFANLQGIDLFYDKSFSAGGGVNKKYRYIWI